MAISEILPLLVLPFVGTVIGSGVVLFLNDRSANKAHRVLLGFASGVMVAASVWSLLIPAMEKSSEMGSWAWVPAVSGFLLGVFFMLLLDTFTPHLHLDSDKPEGPQSKLGRSSMLVLAVTLHNIPEGMAVGAVVAGALAGDAGITIASAAALALGMAIQNIPEGAIVALPMRSDGMSRGRAFGNGILSGIVEPIAAVLMVLLYEYISPTLPYLLAFSAGAMLYVVVEELIPETQQGKHSNIGTIAFALGFVVMMILDVALG